MAKLELQLLVGAESKEWLAGVENVLERLEKVAATLTALPATAKNAKQAEEDFDEDEQAAATEDEDTDFAATKKTAKKTKAAFDEDEETVEASEDEESEDFTEPTTKKAKKLTVEDVNDACKKRASKTGGKEGRTEVLGILKKKFKTTSVSELKPEQYAAVIAAMGA